MPWGEGTLGRRLSLVFTAFACGHWYWNIDLLLHRKISLEVELLLNLHILSWQMFATDSLLHFAKREQIYRQVKVGAGESSFNFSDLWPAVLFPGYPSCVVPSAWPTLKDQQTTGGQQDMEPDGAKGRTKVQLHPMVGGPYPLRDDPIITARVLSCCMCGILLTVLLLYLLFQYVRQQTKLLVPHVDVGNLDFHNAIYTQRVAEIIRSAASAPDMRTAALGVTPFLLAHHQALSRGSSPDSSDTKGRWSHVTRLHDVPRVLCFPIPPRLSEYKCLFPTAGHQCCITCSPHLYLLSLAPRTG